MVKLGSVVYLIGTSEGRPGTRKETLSNLGSSKRSPAWCTNPYVINTWQRLHLFSQAANGEPLYQNRKANNNVGDRYPNISVHFGLYG